MNLTSKKNITTGAASRIRHEAVEAFSMAGTMVILADLQGPALKQARAAIGAKVSRS